MPTPASAQSKGRTSFLKEVRAHAGLDSDLLDRKAVSGKKIAELMALVGQLSESLLATRTRQSQLAELLDASFRNVHLNLAGLEAHFEKALDERLTRFEQTKGVEASASDETLNALNHRLDAEVERNETALSDIRASLEKIEQNVACSETQLEEALDGRLKQLEQVKDRTAEAIDERLTALDRRFEAEAERNENLISEFRSSLTKIDHNQASSETRLEQALEDCLTRFERTKGENAKASSETLTTFNRRLEAETARNETVLSDVRASMEKIEQNLASSEARLGEALDGLLTRIEEAKGIEAKANDETLKALNQRLETETARNENALSDIRSSLTKIEQNLANSEARFEEALDERLRRFEQARDEKIESTRKIVEELMGEGNIREAMEMHWNKRGS